jgi:cytoskeletal protein RodZ
MFGYGEWCACASWRLRKHLTEGHTPNRYFTPYHLGMHFPWKSCAQQIRPIQEFAASPPARRLKYFIVYLKFGTQLPGYPALDLLAVATRLGLSYDVPIAAATNPMGEFGEKFRKAREKKELSLDDVSNVTKISSRMLRAIEEEHFDDLPGGVFNKGFIRAYAKHLGLDSEEAVTDYLASLRQAQIDAQEVWDAQPSGPARSGSNGKARPKEAAKVAPKPATGKAPAPVEIEELPELQLPRAEDVHPARKQFANQRSSGTPWRIVLAAALVAGLGISLWVRHSIRTHAADTSTTNLRSAPAQAAVPALASAPVAATSPLASEPANSKAAVNPTAPQPAANSSAEPAPQPSPDQRKADSSDVTVTNLEKSPAKPAQKTALALSLVIRAAENSWVSASADGQLVTEETLIAPAHTSVRAAREISVRVGNAAGVSFIFNGQEIAAQGAEAEVRNYTFDSGGMHTSSAITAVP